MLRALIILHLRMIDVCRGSVVPLMPITGRCLSAPCHPSVVAFWRERLSEWKRRVYVQLKTPLPREYS
jgi:hypothetical protein